MARNSRPMRRNFGNAIGSPLGDERAAAADFAPADDECFHLQQVRSFVRPAIKSGKTRSAL
jgi:hypothetical protein